MGYAQYLCRLLAPLGIYNLQEHSISGAAVAALGGGLDAAAAQIEQAEQESLTATATGQGLARREALFARTPVADAPEERRAAIAALLQIDGDSLTPEAIERTMRGCGIRARAQEMEEKGHLRITFPDVVGEPEEFDRIREILLDILPCHLAVEFYFRYVTWAEWETRDLTWAVVEAAEHTWESLERWV